MAAAEAAAKTTMSRLSGMQKQVLSLYRGFLRVARCKPQQDRSRIESIVTSEFRRNAVQVDRKNFLYIEYLLRRGRKQLDQLKSPDTTGLSSIDVDPYLALTSRDEANGWYGGTLLGDFDESSEIYKHYAELCQGPAIDPFQDDREREKYYEGILQMTRVDLADDPAVEAEMEAALREYNSIGNDLGVIQPSCKLFANDPGCLTRWMIGD